MKRKYTKAQKEEVVAWCHATGSKLKEVDEHFGIPASTIGSWCGKIQVNIGQVEPEIAVDEIIINSRIRWRTSVPPIRR